MVVQVLEHLYLGSFDDVMKHIELSENHVHVQAVLTVDLKPLNCEVSAQFCYKHIPILDMENENLLVHLDDAVSFMDNHRLDNKDVIVHCTAGQSRSAAVVIAYLMWKLQMDYKDSFEYLKKLKPDIRPNRGFEEQLTMYEHMGWRLDKTNKAYRQFELERIGAMVTSGREITELGEFLNGVEDVRSPSNSLTYKCKKCRQTLFSEANVIYHMAGIGNEAFSKPWQKMTANTGSDCKSGLFIEPMKWMAGLGEITGKIGCMKCSAKVGSWSWSGERCCCGTWVTPAFHIDNKKVDKSVPVRLPS
ncbi:dual specificity protein phosphatase 12-like [Watersipora subatra]|uniref:dual specificity protein phosphatase 12-like n=1 Tax=Watersipora subatra TaxID=2589382 RepID=UPI00355C85BF